MRIVLAGAQADMRLSLQILLREEAGMEIVGTVNEAASARNLLYASLPDLLILDWALPGDSPDQLLADAKEIQSHPLVIVISRDEDRRQESMAAGADAFVNFANIASDLIPAIKGGLRFTPDRTGERTQ